MRGSEREPDTLSDSVKESLQMATMVLDEITASSAMASSSCRARRAHTARVLFLIDELCRRGGAESALLNTVCWLPERFRCSVMTFRINPALSLLQEFPCPVELLPLRRTYEWNALRMALQLRRFLHKEQVDIVHTFFASADLWGGTVTKLSGRAALVSSRRDMGFQRTTKHQIGYRLGRLIFDKVLTVSERVRQYSIAQDKLDPARVKTLYNPVDVAKLEVRASVAELRERFGLSHASHVIVSVGNIRRVKGFDTLLRAAAIVCREFPKAIFAIAGAFETAEPGYLEQLDVLKDELKIAPNVKLLGAVEPIAPLLRASDMFCLFSRSEGMPNALLEAMACGLPSVATRVGGNEEIIEEGRNGFLVTSGDYRAAATRISALLRNRSLVVQIGEEGRESIQRKFSPETSTSQLVEVYDELMAARTRQP